MEGSRKRKLSADDEFEKIQKFSLSDSDDSDEESGKKKASGRTQAESDDDEDVENDMSEQFSGEEDGEDRQEEGQRMTAFNMTEELEQGHFDSAGNFIWDKQKEIRDNWIDNINWQQIKEMPNKLIEKEQSESGEDSDMDEDNLTEKYVKLLSYMKPGETINASIRRLAGNTRKLSSIERLKLKKAGKLVERVEIDIITALANEILTKTGNMNIYETTYEDMKDKVKIDDEPAAVTPVPVQEAELDMYADDFGAKEKEKLETTAGSSSNEQNQVDT